MLVIRLRRMGAKKRPFFRVVVTESRTPRDSRFLEVLGDYNPRTKPESFRIDRERWAYWLRAGATPSDSVRTLVARYGEGPAPAAETAPASVTETAASAPPSADAPAPAASESPAP